MEPRDDIAFRALYAEVREPELRLTGWSAAEKQAFCDSQYGLQDQHYRCHYAEFEPWAICFDGSVIGRLYFAAVEDMLALMDIAIAAEHRNKGIGTALLQDLLGHADRQKRAVRLYVEPDNPALRLYRRLGFVEFGEAGAVYREMRRQPPAIDERSFTEI